MRVVSRFANISPSPAHPLEQTQSSRIPRASKPVTFEFSCNLPVQSGESKRGREEETFPKVEPVRLQSANFGAIYIRIANDSTSRLSRAPIKCKRRLKETSVSPRTDTIITRPGHRRRAKAAAPKIK